MFGEVIIGLHGGDLQSNKQKNTVCQMSAYREEKGRERQGKEGRGKGKNRKGRQLPLEVWQIQTWCAGSTK